MHRSPHIPRMFSLYQSPHACACESVCLSAYAVSAFASVYGKMGYIGTSGKLEQLVFSEICILRILIFFLHTFISLRETYFTKTMYIRGDQR